MQKLKEVSKNMIRCMRCHGRKKLYKIMSGYSHINSGGVEVDCPLCLGKGEIKSLEHVSEEITEQVNTEVTKKTTKSTKQKDLSHGEENRSAD